MVKGTMLSLNPASEGVDALEVLPFSSEPLVLINSMDHECPLAEDCGFSKSFHSAADAAATKASKKNIVKLIAIDFFNLFTLYMKFMSATLALGGGKRHFFIDSVIITARKRHVKRQP